MEAEKLMVVQFDSPSATIVFDLDGTLVDSLPDMRRAMNVLLAELGRRMVDLAEMQKWVGDGASVLVERALAATGGPAMQAGQVVPLPQMVTRYLAHYQGHAVIETTLYPGVRQTLEALTLAGYVLGVCTNKPHGLSLEVLDGLGIRGFFKAVLGGDSLPVKKPDSGHLRGALTAMGWREGTPALMVGDSANDVLAAKGMGLPVVAVGFGYARVAPSELGADAVIGDFADLPMVAARLLASALDGRQSPDEPTCSISSCSMAS